MRPEHHRSTRAATALLVAGVFMLLPASCTLVRSAPTDDDAAVAFTEVLRMRLDSFSPQSPAKFEARTRVRLLPLRRPGAFLRGIHQFKRERELWASDPFPRQVKARRRTCAASHRMATRSDSTEHDVQSTSSPV